MKNKLKQNFWKKAFLIFAVIALFIAAVMQASSEEERVKYSDMEKEEINKDDGSQEALREYYADLLGYVGTNAKFNTIAAQDDIAVLNITIDGKDKRILTRLYKGAIASSQQDLANAKLIRTESLVVLGNISLKGSLFFDSESIFGPRRLYGIGSTASRYVDEGFARLASGKANVSINPVLREMISGYNVFLSAEGITKGIYVAEKTNAYFVVKSVNANSNVAFSWMLSGARKGFDEHLYSEYGREKGIEIKAEADFEKGMTKIKISGLDRILGLVNLSAAGNNNTSNESTNAGNESANITISQGNQSITLITGNLVDEFGLETDLGRILGEAATLPEIGGETPLAEEETTSNITEETTSSLDNITTIDGTTETIINETAIPEILNNTNSNETITSVLEFTLYSTDEEFVISQIADVTGLSVEQVKKLITFAYMEPENFEDEIIEELQPSLDYIEKVNGSVIIRLG